MERGLASTDPYDRWWAALQLGDAGDTSAVDGLIAQLSDEHVLARLGAGQALEQLGWEPATPTEAAALAVALRRWDDVAGVEAIPALVRALREPSPASALRAALSRQGAAAVPALAEELARGEARSEAASALWRLGDPRASPALVAALADPGPAVRHTAVLALGELGGPEVTEHLLRALDDPHRYVVEAAQHALTLRREIDALTELAREGHRGAYATLARIGRDAIPALEALARGGSTLADEALAAIRAPNELMIKGTHRGSGR